ncbi:hypothetical protein GCM10010483_18940 [Actinokineospora diospyrosa]
MFCVGPLRHPWQDRKAGAEKHGPVRYRRYGCRPPTQNKSAPSSRPGTSDSDCPRAEQVGWGGPDGAQVGTAGSECPGAEQVGWGGPDGGRAGTGDSEERGAGLAGPTRAGWDGTGSSECPGAGTVG